MDPLIQEDVSTGLVQLIADTRLTNSFALAALTALLYDHSASFPDEFALIWQGRWSNVLKILYLWNRYFSAFAVSALIVFRFTEIESDFPCRVFYWVEGTISIFIVTIVDCVLVLRVWILYDKNQRLLYFLVPLVPLEVMIMLLVNHRILPHYETFRHIGPILPGCHPLTFSRGFTIFAIPPLIVSFFMFLMTMYKCNTTLRMGVRARMPLIALFLRDGVFWFLGIFTFVLAAIINWNVARPSLLDLLNDPCIVIFSIMASRALLNIPRVLLQDTEDDLEGSYNSDNFHPTSIIFKPLGELSSVAFQRNEELG